MKNIFNTFQITNRVAIITIFFASIIAYSTSFNVPFQFDDDVQIVNRPGVHSFEMFKSASYWTNINQRPVSTFTLAANYAINKENVTGYHLVNLLIHIFTSIVLFFLSKLLISLQPNKKNNFPNYLPLIIALFFALQPVQTQAVTYIVQRMSILSAFFFLLSIHIYTLGRIEQLQHKNIRKSYVFYGISILSGIMGALSKQNAVVFPAAMLLIEALFIRNGEGKICKKYLLTSSATLVIGVIVSLMYFGIPGETKTISSANYLASQMVVIPIYFRMMLIPFGLSIDHGLTAATGFLNAPVMIGITVLAAIVGFGIFQLKRNPLISFGIFFIFIALIIESSIIPISDVMFEHRMYLPLAGFSIAIWTFAFTLFSKWKPSYFIPFSIVVLLSLATATFARNSVWQTRIGIWLDATEKNPNYARGWMGLGKMAKTEGDLNALKIISYFEKAHQLDPKNEEAISELGFFYLVIKQEEKAISYYELIVDSKEQDRKLQALKALAVFHFSKKNFGKALTYSNKILEIAPNDEYALENCAESYLAQKEFDKSIKCASKLIKIAPEKSKGYFSLGKAFFYSGNRNAAKNFLEKSLAIDPNNSLTLLLYGNVCMNLSNFDEAISSFKKAQTLSNDPKIQQYIDYAENLKAQNSRK